MTTFDTISKYFRSPEGRQTLAQANQVELFDRDADVAEHTSTSEVAGKLFADHAKREAAADGAVSRAKEALTAAERKRADVRRECLAERHPVDLKLATLESRLLQNIPADVASALARLDAAIEHLREFEELDPADMAIFRELFAIRNQLREAGLHLKSSSELAATIKRIDRALNQTAELATA